MFSKHFCDIHFENCESQKLMFLKLILQEKSMVIEYLYRFDFNSQVTIENPLLPSFFGLSKKHLLYLMKIIYLSIWVRKPILICLNDVQSLKFCWLFLINLQLHNCSWISISYSGEPRKDRFLESSIPLSRGGARERSRGKGV